MTALIYDALKKKHVYCGFFNSTHAQNLNSAVAFIFFVLLAMVSILKGAGFRAK